jgi:hypothetical protein
MYILPIYAKENKHGVYKWSKAALLYLKTSTKDMVDLMAMLFGPYLLLYKVHYTNT